MLRYDVSLFYCIPSMYFRYVMLTIYFDWESIYNKKEGGASGCIPVVVYQWLFVIACLPLPVYCLKTVSLTVAIMVACQ